MTCGSANGVDIILAELFASHPHGYAIEAGAFDGLNNSNTLKLEEDDGWTVLCIEPIERGFVDCRQHRKLARRLALGAQDGDNQLFHVSRSGLATSGLVLYPEYVAMVGGPFLTERVNVRRLDRVLEESGFPRLDLLCLDVEGHEREVLKGFTVERWKPAVMVIESLDGTLSAPEGYRQAYRCQFDSVFVRQK